MQRSSRVDYDAIAPLYDSQPHREKSPDPALAAFLAERSALGTALLLDIACGTGSQLVANRAIASSARMVGFDGSLGMVRQARAKSAEIGWVHGDSSALPFASDTFDFGGQSLEPPFLKRRGYSQFARRGYSDRALPETRRGGARSG
jgi:ubiquinone/menaquinone biosynthesis C-methylase UbiE